MKDVLAELVENENFDGAAEHCLRNEKSEYTVIAQKRVVNFCIKQGASKENISNVITELLRKKEFKKAEPFMDFVSSNTLLAESVESNWPDGINYALRKGADNFDFAIFKAIQSDNHSLAEFLAYKKKKHFGL